MKNVIFENSNDIILLVVCCMSMAGVKLTNIVGPTVWADKS